MKKILVTFFYCITTILNSQVVDMNQIVCDNYEQQIMNDPSIDYSKFKTYSLISTFQSIKKEKPTLQEKHIEFFLKNFIYLNSGLKFVALTDSIKPDLLFIYDYSNDYREKYIAPSTYSIPYWKPGQNKRTTINSSSNNSFNVTGDVDLSGDVYSNSFTTINTITPGEWTTKSVQRPGYTVGKYFSSFTIIIYNTKDENKIWEGVATGTTTNKDSRIVAQSLLTYLGFEIPKGSYVDDELAINNNGWLGFEIVPYNSNGQMFYPVIVHVHKNSPSYKKGLKFGDVIISVNGESTANIPSEQLARFLKGDAKTVINLTIDRDGKVFDKELTKVQK